MKYVKILRVLSMAVILSLLVMTLPASAVLAASEDISLDPEKGEIGERVDIDGEDFEPSDYDDPDDPFESDVDIYFSNQEADEGDEIDDEVENYELVRSNKSVDESGDFTTYFNVPAELTDGDAKEVVRGGTYWVYVTEADDEEILAVAEFTVIAAEIELDPDEGMAGIEVEITGAGFNDNEDITVTYDGDELDIYDGDDDTDSDGEFECIIIIPESTSGEHTIEVEDDNGGIAEAVFTVEPEISVDPEEARALSSVTVAGTGFDSSSDITVSMSQLKCLR
jgi:hypothetical protein